MDLNKLIDKAKQPKHSKNGKNQKSDEINNSSFSIKKAQSTPTLSVFVPKPSSIINLSKPKTISEEVNLSLILNHDKLLNSS
jgi:hypothetical protein